MLVPIAFTSDHIETLYEKDFEYAEELVGVATICCEVLINPFVFTIIKNCTISNLIS